jgi:thioredoxin-related protein
MKCVATLIILLFTVTFSFGQGEIDSTKSARGINWLSFEEAFALHQITPKKWVIDVSTEWCGWCKRMDQTTFSDSLVIEHVNANFYAVALDGEFKGDITIGEQTYKFVDEGRRGYHQLPAELMNGQMSYPTIIFFGEDLQNYGPVPGYRDAPGFLQLIEFFEVFHPINNPITWDTFSLSYKSPYPTPVVGE